MSKTPYFLTAVKADGKLTIEHEPRYRAMLAKMPDGRYVVTIEKESKSRSLRANRAYWACIVKPISEHTGYETDEVHELLKRFCNPKVIEMVNQDTGDVEEVTIGGSTAGMTMEEFNLYFRRCQQFAAERLDVVCPDPDPEWMFNAA